MNISDLNNLSLNNIGNWPIPVKAIAILLLCLLALGAGYWYDTKVQLEQLASLERQEEDLKTRFQIKQKMANQLEPLKKQLAQIKDTFSELLKQLPSKTQIPNLLVDISQTGLASGVEFELFEPKKEMKEEDGFYMEVPLNMRVSGTYHQFGKFVSGIANLPRIVTQHDIKIRASSEDGVWIMEETAKTYRYVEDEEEMGGGAAGGKSSSSKANKGKGKK